MEEEDKEEEEESQGKGQQHNQIRTNDSKESGTDGNIEHNEKIKTHAGVASVEEPEMNAKPKNASGHLKKNNETNKSKDKKLPTIPPRPKRCVSTSVVANLSTDVTHSYKMLKEEKALLQKELFDYQEQFKKEHGHTPKTKKERAPKKEKYSRYKELKKEMRDLKEKYGDVIEDLNSTQ
eukprot:m.186923 g.186923  ORF g.186923 m.186923 type:complete len:179 (+) comp13622_c2_seq2:6797-7333(+)